MSSSAIGFQQITYGPTGATGPAGATGLTGPTGGTFGLTGIRGPYSAYVQNITVSGSTATVLLSDGREFEVSGSFFGNTGIDYTQITITDPLDPGVDATTYSLLASGNNTSSFVMRGISAYGSLYVTEDSEAIYIDSIYGLTSGSLDSIGLLDNTLVYLKQRNQISSTTIGITSGAFYTGVLNFEKSNSTTANPNFSKLLPRAKTKYISPTFKTSSSQPITLNINDAGIFYVRTPNGITAFNGSFNDNEIVSFTLIFESDDIWHFPSNVYFQNGENYLTCGKSVVNLTSFDKGTTWYAVVSARGVDVNTDSCELRSLFGSCCYSGPTGTMCLDYSSKAQCDILSGTFNPLQSCETSCGFTFGVCCSNGQCIENTSYTECLAFGGKFLFGVTCGSFDAIPDGDNSQRLCYDKCLNQKVACCKDGICLGDEFTKIECEQILQGIAFFEKACSEVDCCEQNVKIGACCENQTCSQKTLLECKDSGGVFMGEGENCLDVNCECFGEPKPETFGVCCYCNNNIPSCKISIRSECDGTWTEDLNSTQAGTCNATQNGSICLGNPDFNCTSETGQCCYCEEGNTNCIQSVTEQQCTGLGGNFTLGGQCNSPCDPCTSSNGGPCGDCSSGKCEDIEQDTIMYQDCSTKEINCNYYFDGKRTTRESSVSNKSATSGYSNGAYPQLENQAYSNFFAKDYYLQIEDLNKCGSNDEDLQFCFTVQIPQYDGSSSPSGNEEFLQTALKNNSLRIYLLRTWYPKYFATNYAAYKGLTYNDGSDILSVQFVDPTSDNTTNEYNYWNYINNISFYDHLGSYINTLGNDSISYYPSFPGSNAVKYNTDELIKELNCPLYGLNPRGKNINTGTFSFALNPGPNTNNPFNLQALSGEFGITYFSTTNIGVKFNPVNIPAQLQYGGTLSPSIITNNTFVNRPIDFDQYINDSQTLSTGSFLYTSNGVRTIKYSITGNGNQYFKFEGYNDLYAGQFYNPGTINYTHKIGYYIKNAVVNRFANIFTNINTNITNELNIGKNFIGHPLTIDFESNYTTQTFPNTIEAVSLITSNGNKSGLYKTKPTSIIFDSGVITGQGDFIPDISSNIGTERGHLGGYFGLTFNSPDTKYTQKRYVGAINDPYLQQNASFAETIGTYIGNGKYNFCVKLKNYKKYLLTGEDLNDLTQNLLYDDFGAPTSDQQRYTNFKNQLRLVIFSRAHEDSSCDLTNSNFIIPDGQFPNIIEYKSYNYFQDIYNGGVKLFRYKVDFTCSGDQCGNCDNNSTPNCPLCSLEEPEVTNDGVLKTNCFIYGNACSILQVITGDGFLRAYNRTARNNFSGGLGFANPCCCNCNADEEIKYSIGYFCNVDEGGSNGCACKYETAKYSLPAVLLNSTTPCNADDHGFTCPPTTDPTCEMRLTQLLIDLGYENRDYTVDSAGLFAIRLRKISDTPPPNISSTNNIGLYGNSGIQAIHRSLISGTEECPSANEHTTALYWKLCDRNQTSTLNRCVSSSSSCTDLLATGTLLNGCNLQNPEDILDCNGIYPAINQGAICNIPLSGASWLTNTKNKKLYISDTEFVCVTIDCTVEDCDQYEDCSI